LPKSVAVRARGDIGHRTEKQPQINSFKVTSFLLQAILATSRWTLDDSEAVARGLRKKKEKKKKTL
jgi:hypothetical protein